MSHHDDPIAQAEQIAKQLAESASKILIEKMMKLAQERQATIKAAKLADETNQLDTALKESGFEPNKDNRAKLKEWTENYEEALEQHKALNENLGEIDKRLDRVNAILELPPDAQKQLGYGTNDPNNPNEPKLKDPGELTAEKNSLTVQKFKLEDEQSKLGLKIEGLEKGEGLDDLAGAKRTLGQKISGKPAKEPKPGSVFDSLVKSGYMEKGGLAYMNENAVGIQAKPGSLKVHRK